MYTIYSLPKVKDQVGKFLGWCFISNTYKLEDTCCMCCPYKTIRNTNINFLGSLFRFNFQLLFRLLNKSKTHMWLVWATHWFLVHKKMSNYSWASTVQSRMLAYPDMSVIHMCLYVCNKLSSMCAFHVSLQHSLHLICSDLSIHYPHM